MPEANPSLVATDSGPAWLTISQLCRRWQLGRKTVYKFIDAKLLPAWKVGSHLYRVSVADVLRFESQNRLPPAGS
jgi:excisionase family DNA binding protein